MRLLLAIPIAWICGVAAYLAALALIWGQTMSGGDAAAVLFWSAIATALVVPVVYWPALMALAGLLNGYRPFWAFPVAAVGLGVVPTAFVLLMFGGRPRDLASPEAALFYCMFGVVGIVLGSTFALRRERAYVISLKGTMTIHDLVQQPAGPFPLVVWRAKQRVRTSFGEFVAEFHMDRKDVGPPDAEMLGRMNELVAFISTRDGRILDQFYAHYQSMASDADWMETSDVPVDLRREQIGPYLGDLSLIVDHNRDREPAYTSTFYALPRWEQEHGIHLELRDGRLEIQEL